MVNTPHSQQVFYWQALCVNSCRLSWMNFQYFCPFPHNSSAPLLVHALPSSHDPTLVLVPHKSTDTQAPATQEGLIGKIPRHSPSSQQAKTPGLLPSSAHLRFREPPPSSPTPSFYEIYRNSAPSRALRYSEVRGQKSESMSGEEDTGRS